MGENGCLVQMAVFYLGGKSRPAQVSTCTHVTSATSAHPTSGNWHRKYIRTQLNSKITQNSAWVYTQTSWSILSCAMVLNEVRKHSFTPSSGVLATVW